MQHWRTLLTSYLYSVVLNYKLIIIKLITQTAQPKKTSYTSIMFGGLPKNIFCISTASGHKQTRHAPWNVIWLQLPPLEGLHICFIKENCKERPPLSKCAQLDPLAVSWREGRGMPRQLIVGCATLQWNINVRLPWCFILTSQLTHKNHETKTQLTRNNKLSTDRCTEDRLWRCLDGESNDWRASAADNELCRIAVTRARSSTDCRCRTDWLPWCRSCSWMKRRRSRDFKSNSFVRRMLAATSSARLHKRSKITWKLHWVCIEQGLNIGVIIADVTCRQKETT